MVEQLLPLALQLCSALHYMHGQEWAHLDVKPRNIIMSSTPKLIDLSVAQRLEDATADAQSDRDRHLHVARAVRPRALRRDRTGLGLWGLGVTLYEALAGELPFAVGDAGAETLAERYPQVAGSPEPLDDDVLSPLRDAVHACLEDDPSRRPLPAEVAEELEPLVALLPLPRLGRFRPGSRPARPPAPAR